MVVQDQPVPDEAYPALPTESFPPASPAYFSLIPGSVDMELVRQASCLGIEEEDEMRFRRLALVIGAAPVLAVAGCGTAQEAPGVASAGKGTGAASPSASPAVSSDPVKFAECMRGHGIDIKDPEPGGKVQIRIRSGDRGKVEAAQKECGKYLQGGGLLGKGNDPKMRDAVLKFTACMREHGVDMPDPKPGEGAVIKMPKGADPDGKKFKEAHKACEKLLPGAPGGPAE
ncbi:hypothetical protein Ssi03_36680 [Sphaerisporangium siamense]|nr:hypothetical protein Ssi03_36680 [Sphaerisporangium siamense]